MDLSGKEGLTGSLISDRKEFVLDHNIPHRPIRPDPRRPHPPVVCNRRFPVYDLGHESQTARHSRDSFDELRRQDRVFVGICCVFALPNRGKVLLNKLSEGRLKVSVLCQMTRDKITHPVFRIRRNRQLSSREGVPLDSGLWFFGSHRRDFTEQGPLTEVGFVSIIKIRGLG